MPTPESDLPGRSPQKRVVRKLDHPQKNRKTHTHTHTKSHEDTPKGPSNAATHHQEPSPHLRTLTPETRLYRRNFRNLPKNRRVYKLPDPPWNSRLPKPILHGICRCRNHLLDPPWYLHHSLLEVETSWSLYISLRLDFTSSLSGRHRQPHTR